MEGVDVFYLVLPYLLVALAAAWIGSGFGYYMALKDEEWREEKRKEREQEMEDFQ